MKSLRKLKGKNGKFTIYGYVKLCNCESVLQSCQQKCSMKGAAYHEMLHLYKEQRCYIP